MTRCKTKPHVLGYIPHRRFVHSVSHRRPVFCTRLRSSKDGEPSPFAQTAVRLLQPAPRALGLAGHESCKGSVKAVVFQWKLVLFQQHQLHVGQVNALNLGLRRVQHLLLDIHGEYLSIEEVLGQRYGEVTRPARDVSDCMVREDWDQGQQEMGIDCWLRLRRNRVAWLRLRRNRVAWLRLRRNRVAWLRLRRNRVAWLRLRRNRVAWLRLRRNRVAWLRLRRNRVAWLRLR